MKEINNFIINYILWVVIIMGIVENVDVIILEVVYVLIVKKKSIRIDMDGNFYFLSFYYYYDYFSISVYSE